jgi:hypothetical protein
MGDLEIITDVEPELCPDLPVSNAIYYLIALPQFVI